MKGIQTLHPPILTPAGTTDVHERGREKKKEERPEQKGHGFPERWKGEIHRPYGIEKTTDEAPKNILRLVQPV